MKNVQSLLQHQHGTTLIELLVSISISMVVALGLTQSFSFNAREAHDNELKLRANDQAQLLLDVVIFDLRLTGAGMPIGQTGFLMTDATLNSSALPILTTSDADEIHIRRNETGGQTTLTATYTPSTTSLNVPVYSASDFAVGDTVYLSNVTRGGTSGMRFKIGSIAGTTLTVRSVSGVPDYNASYGSSFEAGSLATRVTTLDYLSPADWSGITRNDETGATLIQPKSQLSFRYKDTTGAVMALPLTASTIATNLASVEVTASVRSARPLQDGTTYTAAITKTVALRNLISSR